MGSSKVVVVGLDGGSLDLIKPWIDEGRLPTFKRLMSEGVCGDLAVELPPVTVPNWPSFMTGKNAGKHGLTHWYTRKHVSGQWSVINSYSIREKNVWEIASEHDKRSIVINVPATYPPKKINGIMITGLLTPPSAKDFIYPPTLKGELENNVGQYYVYPDVVYSMGREEQFLESLMRSIELRFRTGLYLMRNQKWDLFTIVFMETDTVQHAFWKFVDPTHPLYDENMSKKYGDGILKVYERVDMYLGEYLKELDEHTSLIVMSDHGAEPFYKKFYTNNWLARLGYLKLRKRVFTLTKYGLFKSGFTILNVYRLLFKFGLVGWTNRANKNQFAENWIRKLFLSYQDIDMTKTKAYAFGGFGQIYVNSEIHNKKVFGSDIEEYERIRNQIISDLKKIEVPGGGLLIEKVFKREDLYYGPNTPLLPDIIFIPRRGYLDPSDFEFSSNRIFDEVMLGSGSHSDKGIFMMWGNAVRHIEAFNGASIHDIAPTILHLADIPVPNDMDGRILAELLKSEWLQRHPMKYGSGKVVALGSDHGYSGYEEEEIKRQLKGLGYIS